MVEEGNHKLINITILELRREVQYTLTATVAMARQAQKLLADWTPLFIFQNIPLHYKQGRP